MKNILIIGFIIVSVLSACNTENNPRDATVSQARGFRDGTYVRISGTIESMISHEWYTFSDHSGSISVEIENEVWARAGMSPLTDENEEDLPAKFEIVGEVDKERTQETIIDVERLTMIP